MRRIDFPNGNHVAGAEISKVTIKSHFFSSSKYYVTVETKFSEDVAAAEDLTKDDAESLRDKIVTDAKDCWDEAEPYDVGFSAGHRSGHAEGFVKGQKVGFHSGYDACNREKLETIQFPITGDLKDLMCELQLRLRESQYLSDDRKSSLHEFVEKIDSILRRHSSNHES